MQRLLMNMCELAAFLLLLVLENLTSCDVILPRGSVMNSYVR